VPSRAQSILLLDFCNIPLIKSGGKAKIILQLAPLHQKKGTEPWLNFNFQTAVE
jgi:hypothetical protein